MQNETNCSARRCIEVLDRLPSRAYSLAGLAAFLSVAAVFGVRHFDPRFWTNPVLVALLVFFLAGQIVLVVQLLGVVADSRRDRRVFSILEKAGQNPDLGFLRDRLQDLPVGEDRDLVLRWVDLGLAADPESGLELLRNSTDRRSLADHRRLGIHALVNRSVMKVGFLGTLVGLVLTFPPMKRAILGLSDSGGEMSFIRDIAQAIDEDAYAIQATLVATGLSLLIESVVVQMLERLFQGREIVDSHLADWNLTVLRPAIARVLRQPEPQDVLQAFQSAHDAMERRMASLTDQFTKSDALLSAMTQHHLALAERVRELCQWEADYRRFLEAKRDAALPPTVPQDLRR